ncbi:hypothetical protein X797_010358 [Metarhizium robertsii]|uniref:Centromere/microtubule binding protein cbf5-like protein n=2 Tax=Metarhizium robertsii TaxID=568076 RepID=E9FAX6_METRA|nr:centromere/microtubule binding protein cbf5-like protein [Metarhizium robertsii ARSEF 23]EFY95098.1 centromere/microtubule binding protein cbf5-like protein [Metarhizium robertsii ARSEF 23]EXU96546.1 hypothetical protein X797_010358 [Metarhizium robertsii]
MLRPPPLPILLAALVPAAQSILVPSGSPCAANCGNILDKTAPEDLVCSQGSFSSDPTGQQFAACVDCERSSTYHSGNDSDIQSMLYNVRYALSYCVWGDAPAKNPKVANTPCITTKACGPFKNAVQFKNLSSTYDAYQYCDLWPTDDAPDFQGCTDCLQAEGRQYMANFVIALQAGCQQKPPAGLYIGLDGELFSTTAVQISTPSPTATVNPAWFDHGPLNLGAKVGIAVGALVALLVVVGCCIIWNGKRRRKAYLRDRDTKIAQRGWPSPTQQREMGQAPAPQSFRGYDDTPVSQRPLRGHGWDDTPVSRQGSRGWDDSPVNANGEKPLPRYFSPYSSQYNSPVSARDGQAMPWPQGALPPNQHAGVAAGGEASGERRSAVSDDKGKARVEAYEMHLVDTSESSSSRSQPPRDRSEAPVLNHPGYGRDGNVPAPQLAVTDHDARRGNVV